MSSTDNVDLFIKLVSGEVKTISVPLSATVRELKEALHEKFGLEPSLTRLINAGDVWEDDETIADQEFDMASCIMAVVSGGGSSIPPPPPAEEPVEADSTGPAASAGSSAGAGAGSGAGTFQLQIKTLRGSTMKLTCDLNETFAQLKPKIAPLVNIAAPMMKAVYQGRPIDNSATPASLHLSAETCIHVVKAGVDLSHKYSRDAPEAGVMDVDALLANCRFCETAGAPVDIRPICRNCQRENVTVTEGEIKPHRGTLTWRSLLDVRGACMYCDTPDDYDPNTGGFEEDPALGFTFEQLMQIKNPISIGFLCKASPPESDGLCPSTGIKVVEIVDGKRKVEPCPEKRKLVCVFDGNVVEEQREKALQKVLNDLYSYAHAAGMQDTVPIPPRA